MQDRQSRKGRDRLPEGGKTGHTMRKERVSFSMPEVAVRKSGGRRKCWSKASISAELKEHGRKLRYDADENGHWHHAGCMADHTITLQNRGCQ